MTTGIPSKLEKLLELADVVQEKTFQIYYNSGYTFNPDHYDTLVIDNDSFFQTHKRRTYFEIIESGFREIDEATINKLLDIRTEKLERTLEKLSRDNIGTCLNMLRELYNDILTDFLRHSS